MTIAPTGRSAGLWARFFAWVIDYILLLFFALSAGFVSQKYPFVRFITPILSMLYAPVMVWKFGATVGKMICHIRVVDAVTAKPLDFGKAFMREIVGKFVSGIVLNLGYLWVLIDPQEQAWHDKIAGTRVVMVGSDGAVISGDHKASGVGKTRKVLFWGILACSILSAIILPLFVLTYLFAFRPVEINGNAMTPTYQDNQFILTSRSAYATSEPKRGDVVIYRSPQNAEVDWIKRIVGLPGERIRIEQGKVFINGNELDESSYLAPGTVTLPGSALQEGADVLIPGGQFVVLGDNRTKSADSREYGFLRSDHIEGKALMCYWHCTK